MKSNYVIGSTIRCLDVGNDEYNILCNMMAVSRMVLTLWRGVGRPLLPPPTVSGSKKAKQNKKKPDLNRIKTECPLISNAEWHMMKNQNPPFFVQRYLLLVLKTWCDFFS